MTVREITKNLDFNLFRERLNQLDPNLKDLVSGGSGSDLIVSLAAKYDFDASYSPSLILLFGLYLTRIVDSQYLVDYLAVFIPEKYFSQFMQELEDKLWSPYDVYLNKAGVIYKQLTKLTPRPVARDQAQPVQEQAQSGKQLSSEISGLTVDSSSISLGASNQSAFTAPVISLKEVVISDLAPSSQSVNQPSVNNPSLNSQSSNQSVSGAARVKFDVPRTGPEINKPTSFEIRPSLQTVKFSEPAIRPEVGQNVSASTPGDQNQQEKKIEIPKAPEIKKTEVSGRQVIDLTSFGISEPDKD